MQNGLRGKRSEGLGFPALPRTGAASAPSKISAPHRPQRVTVGARICKLNQNIMTSAQTPLEVPRVSLAPSRALFAIAGALQGPRAVLFSICRWATGGFQ